MTDIENMRGWVFDIKRDCSEDGPGIRTTVFFQGCPLRCVWCQNPEGQPYGKWGVGSGACEGVSGTGAARCYGLDELIDTVLIDKPFFNATGGGVTVSGGEPACQMHFVGEFLARLRQAGIDTAIETSGFFHYASFEKQLLPYLNRIYIDLKIMDEEAHRSLTGQSNRPILVNLARLARQSKVPINVRVPLVPGMTATDDNLAAIGRFLREHGITEVTLLPYNPLWQDKALKLGRQPQLTCGFMSLAQLEHCAQQVNNEIG